MIPNDQSESRSQKVSVSSSPSIVLLAINGRYSHSSLGLRYLFANLNEFQEQTLILEYALNKNPHDVVEEILKLHPKILGIGVYIWNVNFVHKVMTLIKEKSQEIVIVLGGPEISFETETSILYPFADFIICGEADLAFYSFCKEFFIGFKDLTESPFSFVPFPQKKIKPVLIKSPLPNIKKILMPYDHYSEEDIKHRVIYVEASRGCPFQCAYCLSSLDEKVRSFDRKAFLYEMKKLLGRGARKFKFVDRTFNLKLEDSLEIIQFFLENQHLGLFLHFEMVPDRLPNELRNLLSQFQPGSIQLELGIQTWNKEVANRVSRKQDYSKVVDNLIFLKEHTNVHIHADLIIGLPGENLQSFASTFDQLVTLAPDEIQVGILKRLKGTPISKFTEEFQMIYDINPPYVILQNKDIDRETLLKLSRFAKFWDLYGNRNQFPHSLSFLRILAQMKFNGSLFWLFWDFTEYLSTHIETTHSISLSKLYEILFFYLFKIQKLNIKWVQELLKRDYLALPRTLPPFLKDNFHLTHQKQQAMMGTTSQRQPLVEIKNQKEEDFL